MEDLLLHRNEEFWANLSFHVLRNQHLEDKKAQEAINKMAYQAEFIKNNQNKANTLCSLKNNMDLNALRILLDDVSPGTLKRITRSISSWLLIHCKLANNIVESIKVHAVWVHFISQRFISIINCYVDLVKDIYLLFIIILTVGGPQALYHFPSKLGCILVFLLCGSIIFPLILSSCILAFQRIQEEENMLKKEIKPCKKLSILTKTLFMSLINPVGR